MVNDQRIGGFRSLIEGFETADEIEDGHQARILRLIDEAGPQALERAYWGPGHLTAGGIVLSPDAAEVLLVFHTRLGKWVQPGGHLEPTDLDLDAAARREVAEEVGLERLQPLGLVGLAVHQVPAAIEEPSHVHFDVRFGYRVLAGSPLLGEGASQLHWVSLRDLPRWPVDGSVRRAVARARRAAASTENDQTSPPT